MNNKKFGKLNGAICPACQQTMGKTIGPANTSAILVTDEPEFTDQGLSYPLEILRSELSRAGVDLYSIRITSLVKHPIAKTKKGEVAPDCANEHSKLLWEEFRDRRLIFALGGEIVKLLTGRNSVEMNGIVTTSELTPAVIVCGMNPAVAWHGMIGETRLACQRFAEEFLKIEDW